MTPDINQHLIDQLDFGTDPPGVLLVRELKWPRVVGVVICFFVVPATIVPIGIGLKDDAVVFSLFWAGIAVGLILAAFWLLWQLMHHATFYVALDRHYLYIRRGPNSIRAFPLDDIEQFESANRVMKVRLKSQRRPQTVLKGDYVKDNVKSLTRLFNERLGHPSEEMDLTTPAVQTDMAIADVVLARRQYAACVRDAGASFTVGVLTLFIGAALPAGRLQATLYFITASCVMSVLFKSIGALSSRVSLRKNESRLAGNTSDEQRIAQHDR